MPDFQRLADWLRRDPGDAWHAFTHRLRVGLAVAALILFLSLMR